MARMYSRKRGKSGSTKPVIKKVPGWMRYKAPEVELLVAKLAKDKHPVSEIGMILRDVYGVPSVKVVTGKSVTDILHDKKLSPEIPEELMSLLKKNVALLKHMGAHKQDMTAKRGLQLTISKINRVVKYYKSSGALPADWKYDLDKVKLLAE
ncbi:30S ribosomal protein S15 [Candidatus Woesearchaeota archaeon]|nr:30S ribosomal protein S15 [Candidatus Woesearchaeota archaeon]